MSKFDRLFFVLGMHRSGTSYTAGLLDGMGLSAGREVMPASSANPVGYFENYPIVRFHGRVLAALGSDWHDPRPLAKHLDEADQERLSSWRSELLSILEAQFASCGGNAVIKDPRLCRLLPLWKPVISDSRSRFLLVVRHPAAVADSLFARNKFSATKALALWLIHNLEMERETRAYPREFVFYPEFLQDPISSCRVLQEFIGVDLGEGELDSLVRERVRPELCHQNETWPDAPQALLSDCAEVFSLLQQRASDTKRLDELYERIAAGHREPSVKNDSFTTIQPGTEGRATKRIEPACSGWNFRTGIINNIIKLLGARTYLEIGLGDGNHFAYVDCERKVGVDPHVDSLDFADVRKMTSDRFFSDNMEKFDVIFIDGLHHEDQVERDLINALGALNGKGAIVCHDLNPTTRAMQKVPRAQQVWTGNCWKAWVRLRQANPSLAMVVFDTDYGVGVILPGRTPGVRLNMNGLELGWLEFDRFRGEWLNLMDVEQAREFVLQRVSQCSHSSVTEVDEPDRTGTTSCGEGVREEWREESSERGEMEVVGEAASAVLLYGVLHRSLPHVIDSLRERVIERLEIHGPVDIYYHSWVTKVITNPRGGEKGVCVDTGEIARLLPEGVGLLEQQSDFDASMDWESLLEENPMRPFCSSAEEARITLMNLCRATESLERAWKHFERVKQRSYRRVVVARPDVRFLEDLDVPLELLNGSSEDAPRGKLWLPEFHGWDGLNDRFVIGRETEVGIWCQRSGFLKQWLLDGEGGTSENLLKRWLLINKIEPVLIEFVFQRVRANGRIEGIDRRLGRGKRFKRMGFRPSPIIAGTWSKITSNISPGEWSEGFSGHSDGSPPRETR